jgi:hypothetical protein
MGNPGTESDMDDPCRKGYSGISGSMKRGQSPHRETGQLVIANAENERLRDVLGGLDGEATRLQPLSARKHSYIEDCTK